MAALTLPDGINAEDPHKNRAVAVNGFLAAGGGEFGVFPRGENRRVGGTDMGALVRQAGRATQPFVAPGPTGSPRVRLGG